MSKQSLLLVDGDTRSLRVLEVSLRKAGFMVTAATSVQDALDKLVLHAPDLIISETTFPDGDGFELRRRVRATAEWAEIPFIFLTAEAAIENKIRGLELGVDDYLTKPIYIKEIVTRINILLQKRQRVRFEERRDGRTRFAGRVQDMPVVDVIQTIEISRKSGVIQFVGERGRQAAIYFRDGRVIDAEAGALQGEDAVYRLLTWSEGEFEVVFRTVRRREVITMSSQALLMEGMRRLDEWSRLFEQLPPLTHRFEVDTVELAARLGDVPDDNNRILRLVDGKRTLLEVIDASDVGDLECLQAISRLYFEELLIDLDHGKGPRRDTGRTLPVAGPVAEPMAEPMAELDAPRPVEEVASGSVAAEVAGAAPVAPAPVAADDPPTAVEPDSAAPEPVWEDGVGDVDMAAVGPLMGGYRPSSLRLIDEAVAAAQAIEPSLFEAPEEGPPAEPHARNGVSGDAHVSNGAAEPAAGHPAVIDPTALDPASAYPAAMNTVALRPVERDESGLRMIGSLGRDRAEASGELASLGQSKPRRSETARELVTILPRRITRELPAITSAVVTSGAVTSVAATAVAATAVATTPGTATPVAATPVAAMPVAAMPVAAMPVAAMPVAAMPVAAMPVAATSEPVQDLADSLPTPTPMPTVLAPRPVAALAIETLSGSVAARVSLPGSGVRAPSRSRRILRLARTGTGSGPGLGAVLLIVLATVLAGTAVLLRVRRHARSMEHVEAIQDPAPAAGRLMMPDVARPAPSETGSAGPGPASETGSAGPGPASETGSAGPGPASEMGSAHAGPALATRSAGSDAVPEPAAANRDSASHTPISERKQAAVKPDESAPARSGGGASEVDKVKVSDDGAGPRPAETKRDTGATPGDAPVDRLAEAKAMYDKAHDALDEGDFARAFQLADASLRLRRTARTYLLRAQAQQRLDRVEDALASVDAAAQLAPGFGAVWELRGRILWAARRHDEARAAFEKFLELEPNSPRAASVRRLLNEPR